MAKVMAMTVHVRDDKQREHVFNAGDELPGWAEELMREGGHEDDSPAWTESPVATGEPEKLSQEEHQAAGRPLADRSGSVDEDTANEGAAKVRGEIREAGNAEARKAAGFEEDGSDPKPAPKGKGK